jgi:uncharacterized protein YuzE
MVGVEAMNWTYDVSARALYVGLSSSVSDRQVELAPGVVADVDATGSLVGLEVLEWQPVDVDAIAKRFGLDDEEAKVLKAIILQPAAGLFISGPPPVNPQADEAEDWTTSTAAELQRIRTDRVSLAA